MANFINQLHSENTEYVVQAAVTGNGNGTALDCVDFTGPVTIVVPFGTITASTSATLTVQESADNSTFSSGDVDTVAVTTAAHNNALLLIHFKNFSKRYIRLNWSAFSGTSIAPQALLVVGQKKQSSTSSGYVAGPSAL